MKFAGTRFETRPMTFEVQTQKERIMAREDVAAGKVKQFKGKANDMIGAARGNTGQQLKGKLQKGIGKAEAKLGKAGRNR